MIDFGFDKLALIGAVALIVIGPEKLPKVARTLGHLVGKAQRYVADVKAEVNRSIELEELKKMKSQFETAARDVEQSVQQEVTAANASTLNDGASAMLLMSRAKAASLGLKPLAVIRCVQQNNKTEFHIHFARIQELRRRGTSAH